MPHSIQSKSILNKRKTRDSWFLDEYTLNPYSGCSFNCLYCYIRGSKYGTHMEEKLSIKEYAPELLDKELANLAKKGRYGFIMFSSATDPYLQFEKESKISRNLLEIILKHKFPVHVLTKSDLVERDFDLLAEINRLAILPEDLKGKLPGGLILSFSFSSLDDKVSAIFEPGATPPSLRLATHKKALEAGFLSGISLMPLLPWISDTAENLEEFYRTFSEAGSGYVLPASLTLFGAGTSDSKTLFMRAITKHYPHLTPKYQTYFKSQNEMPAYYTTALHKKLEELSKKYSISSKIER